MTLTAILDALKEYNLLATTDDVGEMNAARLRVAAELIETVVNNLGEETLDN